jgi:hypothetical protein
MCKVWYYKGVVASGDVDPIVADGLLYFGVQSGDAAADTLVAVYDAKGINGCVALDSLCDRLYAHNVGPTTITTKAVDGSHLYVTTVKGTSYQLSAFDKTGSTPCTPSARVCTPLWTAPLDGEPEISVANGVVYVAYDGTFTEPATVATYDAKGSIGCSGSPRICTRLSQVRTSNDVTGTPTRLMPSSDDTFDLVIANGSVYVPRNAFNGFEVFSARCESTLVVGLRGSGQTAADSGGLGPQVASAVGGFTGRSGARAVVEAIDYTAAGVPSKADAVSGGSAVWNAYFSSINEGVSSLSLSLATHASACPNQKLAFFGYSQGAMVVDRYLDAHKSEADFVNRVLAVGLVADPDRRGSDVSYNIGTASTSWNGVAVTFSGQISGGSPQPPQVLWGRTRSLCLAGDPVCGFNVPDIGLHGFGVHSDSYQGVGGPAQQMGSQLGAIPN